MLKFIILEFFIILYLKYNISRDLYNITTNRENKMHEDLVTTYYTPIHRIGGIYFTV